MLNKFDLQREVCSLDLMIRAVSFEMARLPECSKQGESRSKLIKEMEEALCRLRQERGLRKILLIALENECGKAMATKQVAGRLSQIAA
jgi:hypothetical protein